LLMDLLKKAKEDIDNSDKQINKSEKELSNTKREPVASGDDLLKSLK
jgi:hypothetical protein